MKILAFSDLHRDKDAARALVTASSEADVVVGAGDFGTMGEGIADTIEILRAITVPTILVSGNHDNLEDLRLTCQGWKAADVLHGQHAIIDGVTFFGLGMEVPQRAHFSWNNFICEEEAAAALAKCPQSAVLVTHSPPYGDVCDLQTNGEHESSTAIQGAIESKQPELCLCGHIHHSWGTEYAIGRSKIANLGPSLNWFEI
jgi:Icc-related predicted phosphoesterase